MEGQYHHRVDGVIGWLADSTERHTAAEVDTRFYEGLSHSALGALGLAGRLLKFLASNAVALA